MDRIVSELAEHPELIEEKIEEIKKSQEDGNKIYGTNISFPDGKLTLSALIDLASEFDIITQAEKKSLIGLMAKDEVEQMRDK